MFLKLPKILIQSNIFISLAAVLLTLASQIQLGLPVQWHPYLFLIFFATLFEYNLHRLITIFYYKEALQSEKHTWVRDNLLFFYFIVLSSIIGFFITLSQAKLSVLLTLSPLALATLFYSTPVFKTGKFLFRIRQIPYIKIFIISLVWSGVTLLLPLMYEEKLAYTSSVGWMLVERFLFVFSITIPFDIRDMEADKINALQTLPLFLGKQKSILLAATALVLFMVIIFFHYTQGLRIAFLISGFTTLFFILSPTIQKISFYHYGILDGTMLLQGILVLVFA